MNDEAIVRLRNEMYTAADADIEENEAGRYAVHKLRMLQNVVEMMQKCAAPPLHQFSFRQRSLTDPPHA